MNQESRVSPEISAITQFLESCVPFDQLTPVQRQECGGHIQVVYRRAGETVVIEDLCLKLVRSGAVELRDETGALLDRCAPGDSFGARTLLTGEQAPVTAVALEDLLLYLLPASEFERLRRANRDFERYFHRQQARRMRRAVYTRETHPQLTRRVRDLMSQRVVTCHPSQRVEEAARIMTDERVSSILVVDDAQALVGILTDRDLRSRVLARGADGQLPVVDVMSQPAIAVEPESLVFDALLLMSDHDIHHLPVAHGGRPLGVVTTTDLVRSQQADPVFTIHDIGRRESPQALAALQSVVPEMLRFWVSSGARAVDVGRVLTTVSDAFCRRLLKLAERELGPPPVPYVWLGFGSQGRAEQALGADQDNALLVDDTMEEAHAPYFAALAQYVCQGLIDCGYRECPGKIMATNPVWRLRFSEWWQVFDRWIRTPTPSALMHASIFFDIRAIYGDTHLLGRLQARILENTRGNTIFLACLTENALKHTPPLGFFKQFVLERSGAHRNTLDLKHRGLVPIIDIARCYALAAGIPEVNTHSRLQALSGSTLLTRKDARSLDDAFEYIAHLRVDHQARRLRRSEAVDNHLSPESLSSLNREQLRDAFDVVHQAQKGLALKFGRGF